MGRTITTVGLLLWASIASAQRVDTARVGVPYQSPVIVKDPALAGVVGFMLTGGGQLYSGKKAKGLAVLALALGGVAIAASNGPTWSGDATPTMGQLGGYGLAVVSWAYGMFTAPGDAREYNRRERDRRRQ